MWEENCKRTRLVREQFSIVLGSCVEKLLASKSPEAEFLDEIETKVHELGYAIKNYYSTRLVR
jgi:hypothetical protein